MRTSPASFRSRTARRSRRSRRQATSKARSCFSRTTSTTSCGPRAGWTGPNYAVAYAVGTSPFGPFERVGKILQQDSTLATGAGHHSVLHSPASDKWYIVYHRRPLGETDRNHRVVSIDELRFDSRGFIQPVVITKNGRLADPTKR